MPIVMSIFKMNKYVGDVFDEYFDNSNMVCITNLFFHAFGDGNLSKSAHFSFF